MAGFFLLVPCLLLVLFSWVNNRDLFSPAKFYLLNLIVFFGDIFVSDYSWAVRLLFLSLVVVGWLSLALERNLGRTASVPAAPWTIEGRQYRWALAVIWAATIVPIVCQLYLLRSLGGFEGYVNRLGNRVVEFQGLGALTIGAQSIAVITIVYFAVLLHARRASVLRWLPFVLHLVITVSFGLLSGSRSSALYVFLQIAMVYNYTRGRMGAKTTSVLAVALLLLALVIGQARNGYRVTEEGIKTGLTDKDFQFSSSTSRYGTIPLEFVTSGQEIDFQYGLTYLAGITNLIPRKLWPDKLRTGGIVLTQEYLGDYYENTSHYSTGAIAEGYINFGFLGYAFGFLFLLAVAFANARFYRRMSGALSSGASPSLLLSAVLYATIIPSTTSFTFGEFATTLVAVLTRAIPALILFRVIFGQGRPSAPALAAPLPVPGAGARWAAERLLATSAERPAL